MMLNVLMILIMIVTIIIQCFLYYCQRMTHEITVNDDPPVYSAEGSTSDEKSPKTNLETYVAQYPL